MNIKYILNIKFFILSLFSVFIFSHCSSGNGTNVKLYDKKPNIIFIFTDDQALNTIRELGNQEIYTPNIDQLVKSGVTFTNAFNMGSWSGAVCVPSRTMLNSGRSVWDAKKLIDTGSINDSLVLSQSWASQMKKAGYRTFMTGKWHVQMDANKIFDLVVDKRPGMPRDAWQNSGVGQRINKYKENKNSDWNEIMPVGYNRPLSKNDLSWSPADTSFGGFWEGGIHWTEKVKLNAIEFIEQQSKDEAFFMYLAFNAPHDPRQAPQEYLDLYPLDSISLPPNYQPQHPQMEEMGCGRNLRDECLAPFPRSPLAVKTHLKEYYASISYIDKQVGDLMTHLRVNDLLDNTYIFFTSDHGLAIGQHGLMGKQNMYDHSIKVPMILVGPGLKKNTRVDHDIYLQDIMPTSLDLAGVEKPDFIFFNSLLDLAHGESEKGFYESIYGAYTNKQRMIRKEGYKLIVIPEAKKVMLFNLKDDPFEMNDLSNLKEERSRLISLYNDLLELQINLNDKLDLGALKELQGL